MGFPWPGNTLLNLGALVKRASQGFGLGPQLQLRLCVKHGESILISGTKVAAPGNTYRAPGQAENT